MVNVGADKKELHNAVAFELSKNLRDREAQLAFNRQLVDHANDLLGPVSGTERVASVGCGHMAAFIKADLLGAKTSEQSLMDGHGHLNLSTFLVLDPELASMLDDG